MFCVIQNYLSWVRGLGPNLCNFYRLCGTLFVLFCACHRPKPVTWSFSKLIGKTQALKPIGLLAQKQNDTPYVGTLNQAYTHAATWRRIRLSPKTTSPSTGP